MLLLFNSRLWLRDPLLMSEEEHGGVPCTETWGKLMEPLTAGRGPGQEVVPSMKVVTGDTQVLCILQ